MLLTLRGGKQAQPNPCSSHHQHRSPALAPPSTRAAPSRKPLGSPWAQGAAAPPGERVGGSYCTARAVHLCPRGMRFWGIRGRWGEPWQTGGKRAKQQHQGETLSQALSKGKAVSSQETSIRNEDGGPWDEAVAQTLLQIVPSHKGQLGSDAPGPLGCVAGPQATRSQLRKPLGPSSRGTPLPSSQAVGSPDQSRACSWPPSCAQGPGLSNGTRLAAPRRPLHCFAS